MKQLLIILLLAACQSEPQTFFEKDKEIREPSDEPVIMDEIETIEKQPQQVQVNVKLPDKMPEQNIKIELPENYPEQDLHVNVKHTYYYSDLNNNIIEIDDPINLPKPAKPIKDYIKIAWEPSEGATGYYIYYGIETGIYDHVLDTGGNACDETTCIFIIGNLYPGTYYINITAYDDEFFESDYAGEIVGVLE